MKNKIVIGTCLCLATLTLTACGKAKQIEKPFTITCENNDSVMEGVKATNKSIYKFGKDQYVTSYEVTTISTYKNEETYKVYKESAKDTEENNDSDKVVYKVDTDDSTKTVKFNYVVTLEKADLNALEDKDYYKAKQVLERAESTGNKCKIKGAKRKQLN